LGGIYSQILRANYHVKCDRVFAATRNSLLGRQELCAVVRILLPAKVQMHKPKDLERRQQRESYGIHFSPWHASHALRREYVKMLHSHKLQSSGPLGPKYEYPLGSAGSLYAVNEMRQQGSCMQDKTKKTTHSPRCIPTTGMLRPRTDFGLESCMSEHNGDRSDNGQGYMVTTACIPIST
jgi:hypothetical protein